MSALKILAIPLCVLVVILAAGSLYLRREAAAHIPSGVQVMFGAQPPQYSEGIVEQASKLFSSTVAALSRYHGEFESGFSTLQNSLFHISRVDVSDTYYLKPSTVRMLGHFDKDTSIFSDSLFDRVKAIEEHPWIEEVEVQWQILPVRLKLSITEAEPWIVAEYAGHSWLLSRQRKLLSPTAVLPNESLLELSSTLSRIDGLADSPGVENYLSSENARLDYSTKMVALLEMAKVFDYPVDRYTLHRDGSLLVTAQSSSEHAQVRLNVHTLAEAEAIATQLRAVVTDLSRRGEKVHEIDMRFHPQIIVH